LAAADGLDEVGRALRGLSVSKQSALDTEGPANFVDWVSCFEAGQMGQIFEGEHMKALLNMFPGLVIVE